MSEPQAVVFDLGKVLVDFDYRRAVRRVGERSTVGEAGVRRLLLESPLLAAYERGELTSAAFFEGVRRETGFQGDFEEFAGYFADIFTPIPEMIQLHADLRARRVPTYIFSNTNDLAIAYIRRTYPFFGGFDGYVLSYEVGSMKPEPAIYTAVERMTGRSGGQLVYIDDRPENITTGAERGWLAVLHEDPAATRARVVQAGFLDA